MSLEPESKNTPDRSIILPILLAVFSLFGILLVFVIGNLTSSRNATLPEVTDTPFKYQLIGTEPGISTSEPPTEESGLENPPEDGSTGSNGLAVTAQQGSSSGSGSNNPTQTKTSSFAGNPTSAGEATDPIIVLGTPSKSTATSLPIIIYTTRPPSGPIPTISATPSRTPRATNTSPTMTPSLSGSTSATSTLVALVSGIYDDSHPLIAYSGWGIITDSNAYQSTLHVSNTSGSTIVFRFTGKQLRLNFQAGGSFGVIEINLGGYSFDLNQSNGSTGANEWVSPQLAYGIYTVTITHLSGGSVNVDSFTIPDTNTPTVTLTSAPGSP